MTQPGKIRLLIADDHPVAVAGVAETLQIGYETVKEHVEHILRKIGLTDRTQAAAWAIRKGLV